ncbi:damage inducible protein CinA [Streptococcus pneumoniae]|nr:damage inducible protein CinA [Streptococcus pneumoniae]
MGLARASWLRFWLGHPVGTVFIGLAQDQGTEVIKVNIGGRSRADVRHIAVMHAFNLVRKALLSD